MDQQGMGRDIQQYQAEQGNPGFESSGTVRRSVAHVPGPNAHGDYVAGQTGPTAERLLSHIPGTAEHKATHANLPGTGERGQREATQTIGGGDMSGTSNLQARGGTYGQDYSTQDASGAAPGTGRSTSLTGAAPLAQKSLGDRIKSAIPGTGKFGAKRAEQGSLW